MRHKVVRRLYWDFENEERWLNSMAAKGQALVHYGWATYTFEPSTPGEWIYRIELLAQLKSKPESQGYLAFMAEAGVQVVATHWRWVYFRKPAVEGSFEVFSDLDSRITHYKRVLALFVSLFAALVPITIVNTINVSRGELTLAFVLPLFSVQLAVFVLLAVQGVRMARRVRSLEAQKQLFE